MYAFLPLTISFRNQFLTLALQSLSWYYYKTLCRSAHLIQSLKNTWETLKNKGDNE